MPGRLRPGDLTRKCHPRSPNLACRGARSASAAVIPEATSSSRARRTARRAPAPCERGHGQEQRHPRGPCAACPDHGEEVRRPRTGGRGRCSFDPLYLSDTGHGTNAHPHEVPERQWRMDDNLRTIGGDPLTRREGQRCSQVVGEDWAAASRYAHNRLR